MKKLFTVKIQKHTTIKIDFIKNKTEIIKTNNDQLFEKILLNRNYEDIPFIVSRIFTDNSVSHNLASILAIEKIFKIKTNPNIQKLRLLLICSQMIQSHAEHLFFQSSLTKFNSQTLNNAIKLIKISENLTKLIGGHNLCPVTPKVGGFRKAPDKKQLEIILIEIEKFFNTIINMTNFFSTYNYPDLNNPTNYLILNNQSNYTLISDYIESSNGEIFSSNKYTKKIKTSQQPIMLGAIARISLNAKKLNPLAKKTYQQALDKFDSFPAYNNFHSFFAQSIEIIHFLEQIKKLIKQLIKSKDYQLTDNQYQVVAGRSYSTVESPQGIIYHEYEIDKKGLVKKCKIITPSTQTLDSFLSDINLLLQKIGNLPQNQITQMVKKLVQAHNFQLISTI